MEKLINHLIQLQELNIARAQNQVSKPGSRLDDLDKSIDTLLDELPLDLRDQFNKLQKRSSVSIVPIFKGNCSACGMSIPVSLVHTVKAAESIYNCPNCARILYVPDAQLEGIGKRKRFGEAVKGGVSRFSSTDLMIPKLAAKTRDEAIAEMCQKLEEVGFTEDCNSLIEEAFKREAISSTAVDNGLAFPHVRGVEGGGLTLALGISKKGIKFSETQRILTRIIFFVVIPTAASAFYLKLLSGLVQTFRDKEVRDKVMVADTPATLWRALVKVTKTTVS